MSLNLRLFVVFTLIALHIQVSLQNENDQRNEEIDKIIDTPPEYFKIVDGKLVKYPYNESQVAVNVVEFLKKNRSKKQTLFHGFEDDLDAQENSLQIPSPLIDKKASESDERLDEEKLAQFNLFGGNPSETPSGEVIFDGDIAIHKPEGDENEEVGLQMRKATANPIILWPNNQIKYVYHSSITPKTQRIIEQAMEHWEEHTCLTFKEKAMFDSYPFWYIRYRNDLSGCYSYIGNTFLTLSGQDVSIGKGCEQRDIVIHEIGHAVGFYHEQARSDRQEYTVLLSENIGNRMHAQFQQQRDNNHGAKYDYSSIMQYGPMAFSRSPYEKNTLVTKDPHYQRFMGKYSGLTFRDRKIANSLYECNADCPNLENTTCQNNGYLKPFRPDYPVNCECDCPPGTSGELCENITGEYYPPPICGGNITDEQTIETPNYPERKNPNEDCSWWIQAPPGKKVRVQFQDFSFDKRLDVKNHKYEGLCTAERVEIRTKNLYKGEMYCGEDIEKGTQMESRGQDFIIIILANSYMVGRGLKADVTFF